MGVLGDALGMATPASHGDPISFSARNTSSIHDPNTGVEGIYPASLQQRLAAYKAWRAQGGQRANFRRFVAAHTPKARGTTLYHDNAQLRFGRWARSVDSPHGNSAFSPKTAYLYRLLV